LVLTPRLVQTLVASNVKAAPKERAWKPNGDRIWRSYIPNLVFGAQCAGVHKCPVLSFGESLSEPFSGWLGFALSGAKRAAAAFICFLPGRPSVVRNRHSSKAAAGIQDFPRHTTVNKGWMRLPHLDRFGWWCARVVLRAAK
jgi:hypothetical protein